MTNPFTVDRLPVLAGHDDYSRYFSIYRAHPLLLQFSISLLFQLFGVSDAAARAVPAIFGVLTILITYFIGKTLYNKKVGLVSALVLAFLPYHIIITRQALVDVPLSFFFILTLFLWHDIYVEVKTIDYGFTSLDYLLVSVSYPKRWVS